MDERAVDVGAGGAPTTAPRAGGYLQRRAKVITPAGQALRRFRRHRLAVLGVALVALFVLLALFAPLVARVAPNAVDLRARNQGPTLQHWFGTDRTGRDTFARTLYAGRVSLSIGFVAATISIAIGGVLGAVSGYFGGLVDGLVMRFTDVVMTFP